MDVADVAARAKTTARALLEVLRRDAAVRDTLGALRIHHYRRHDTASRVDPAHFVVVIPA